MKDKTIVQCLFEIKEKCNVVAISRISLSAKDILLYTLNGLPSTYQAFKITIKTNLQSISLHNFYELLCSKELNLQVDATKNSNTPIEQQFALISRGRGNHGRARVNNRS